MANEIDSYRRQLSKMERPIPGQSLTNNPDTPMPFERAPEFTKKKDAMESIFSNMIREDIYPQVMGALASGSTVMELTQNILMEGFRQGKWNPDLFMLLVEPTAYMTMALAERAEIDYKIDDDPDDDEVNAKQDTILKEKFSELNKKVSAATAAEQSNAVPKDILEKIKTMPKKEDSLLGGRIQDADFATPSKTKEEVMQEAESLLAPGK